MRGRSTIIREASPRSRGAAASPGLRVALLWISIIAALFVLGCSAAAHAQSGASTAAHTAALRVRAERNFANLPLRFEENRGQTDARVKFLARGPGYTLFLTGKEAVFAFLAPRVKMNGRANGAAALRLRFENVDPRARIAGQDEQPGKTNYFPSGDRSTWHTGIPSYSAVVYRSVYPGVNAVFHGSPRLLEFDFDLAPGADPSSIVLDFDGGRALRIDGDGNVVLGLGKSGRNGEIALGKPVVYQEIAGVRHEIAGRFVLRSPHRIGFSLGNYNHAQPLTIDPTLSYSTYFGGISDGSTYADSIALDPSGNAYITGGTNATDLLGPTPTGTGPNSFYTGYVTKLNADGSLAWTSILPEGLGAWAIAVDKNGSAYVSGADPYGFTTAGAYQGPYVYGADIFTVAKLSVDGSTIVYAAQIGSGFSSGVNVFGMAIAVDSSGSAYVAASANISQFPTTPGAYQASCWTTGCTTEATVSKLSPDGSSLVYSTLLGGHGGDYATGIAVDANGDAFVTGTTGSTDFPATAGALQPACSSSNSSPSDPPYCSDDDAFVSELNPTGTALIYSTFLGNGVSLSNSPADQLGIAIDASGNAYIAGTTDSTVFTNGLSSGAGPTNLGPQVSCGSEYMTCPDDLTYNFVAKVAPGGGTLAYLGFLGGYNANPIGTVNGDTLGDSVAVDSSGNAYLTGYTDSSYFPVTSDALLGSFQEVWPYAGNLCGPTGCGSEAYLSIFNTEAAGNSSLVYSTLLGPAVLELNPTFGMGIAVSGDDDVWLAGYTQGSTFPTTSSALQPTCVLYSSSPPVCNEYAFVSEFTTGTTTTAAAIAAVSGGGQSAVIGTNFANSLVVKVTDASNDPVSGAVVTFSVPASGASAGLSSTSSTTGSDGTASVTATANGIASSTVYQVSATVSGVTTPATFSLTNTPAATTLTVAPSALSLVYGQMVTIAASISPASVAGSSPTGSVAFYEGSTTLTLDAPVSNAAASYTVNVPTVGSHTYQAQYEGDTNFSRSALTSATSAAVVSKANTTLAGPTTPVTITAGQSGSIPVTISGQYTGSGIAGPSGGLNYSVSGNAFGPGSLLVANGTATISVPNTLPAGNYTVTVSYAGDGNYNSDSINIQLVIAATVGGSVSGLTSGLSVVLRDTDNGDSVTVTWPATSFTLPVQLPTGASYDVTVLTQPAGEICTVLNGSGKIASSNVTNVGVSCAVATYSIGGILSGLSSGDSVTLLNNGTDALTISANGSFAFSTQLATGNMYDVTVGTQPTGESCLVAYGLGTVASQNVTTVAVTCTANISSPLQVKDNETITVDDSYGALLSAQAPDSEAISVVDTVTVGVSGYPILNIPDNETITVSDSDQAELGALSGASEPITVQDTVNVQVLETPTVTTLLVPSASIMVNSAVTLAASVSSSSGPVSQSGSVAFSVNGSVISGCSAVSLVAGAAACTTSALPAGSDTITAAWSGDSGFLPSVSPAETVTITDFQLSVAAPHNLLLWPGQSVSFPFTLAPANGAFTGTISFAMTGLPQGVTASFSPQTVTLGNSPVEVMVTLTALSLAALEPPAGGPSNEPGNRAPLLAFVLLPLLGSAGMRRRLRRGGWLALVLLLSSIAVSGLSACGSSNGFFNQSPQTYNVTLTATSGTATHSSTFPLTLE